MKFILKTLPAGFGNRFGPLLSLYRICRKYNIEFLLVWEKDTFNINQKNITFPLHFQDIFQNKYIKNINSNEFDKIKNSKNTLIFPYPQNRQPPIKINNLYQGYNIVDLNLLKNYHYIIFYHSPHLYGLCSDPMNKWIPYTKKMGIYEEDNYIKELKFYFKEFQFNQKILKIVHHISTSFTKNMMGIQIRGEDSGGINPEKSYTYELLINKIKNFLTKKDSKIFLTTLHKNIQEEIITKFPNRIITHDILDYDSFNKHRDSKNDLIIAISNLLLLSKCDYIIGTAGSSYSFMSFIFGNCNTYETLLGRKFKN